MSFFEWLKELVFPSLKRNVSRLDSLSEEDTDTVFETVDTSGGPLKESHLRKAFRDPRLLPKKKAIIRLGKRRKYLSSNEARRLFSETMRTQNRNIRDLLPDEEQLRRYGLPLWKNEQDLADALGIPLKTLRFFSIHRNKEKVCHYVTFIKPKRSGEDRRIMAPKRRLKKIQKTLLSLLVQHLPVTEFAHGFKTGRSVRTGAEPHVGKKVVLHLDIKEFFPSIHFGRVRGLLIALGYGFPVATTLAVIMTEAERQPVKIDEAIFFVPVTSRYCVQGAPTSPGLSNAIFACTDRRLAKLAQKFGFSYSRYADDLTFSGNDLKEIYPLYAIVRRIIEEEGFSINQGKTRFMRSGRRQTVTGVVVNKDLGLSRKDRRLLRAMIHSFSKCKTEEKATLQIEKKIQGKIAYLSMLNPAQATPIHRIFTSSQ